MNRRFSCILFSLAIALELVLGMCLTVWADGSVPYKAWNAESQQVVDVEGGCSNYTEVTSTTMVWENGWYVVPEGEVTINDRISVKGNVHLILCDGAKLTASKGITVNTGHTLNIYGQSKETGILVANGYFYDYDSYFMYYPGIGANDFITPAGDIIIHGGTVTAQGTRFAAGIGGACEFEDTYLAGNATYRGGNGGNVTIYHGTVTAAGGSNSTSIGKAYNGRSDGTLTLGTGVKLYGNDSGMPEGTDDTDLLITGNGGVYDGPRYRYMKASLTVPDPVDKPSFSPDAGKYNAAQNVTINCATDSATIYYTTDGSDPTTNSTAYSSPIEVSSTTTIKAFAVKDGMPDSEIASAKYEIDVDPHGYLDSVTGGVGGFDVAGWAFDPSDTTQQIEVHVYIGGEAGSAEAGDPVIIKADTKRDDVNKKYNCGERHGFRETITTSKRGEQAVYVYAINIGDGKNKFLGNKTVTITEPEYQLQYDPGDGGSGSMAPETVKIGDKVILPECSFTAPSGKTFYKWQISGVDGIFDPGYEYTVVENSIVNNVITVTATWKATVVTKVTVNAATVSAKAIGKAVEKAGTSNDKVKTIVLGKKVRKISKSAFKKYKKAKTLIVKTRKLKKSSVKGSLKGSKVTKIKVQVGRKKVNKKYVKKYKKIFTKKNAGKKVKVTL